MIRLLIGIMIAGGTFCGMAALGDLISEEIRGWLDLVPEGILYLAARRIKPAIRQEIYEETWLPDLAHALRGAEARPITRLIRGVSFAVGLILAAGRINRHIGSLGRTEPEAKSEHARLSASRKLAIYLGLREDPSNPSPPIRAQGARKIAVIIGLVEDDPAEPTVPAGNNGTADI